ncbi:MAG: hypothetical protein ACO1OF_01275 [Adhaeribacter sp.]
MKNNILVVGIMMLLACRQKNAPAAEVVKSEFTSTSEYLSKNELWIAEINKEDFDIRESGDTIFYRKKLDEGIEGKKIRFDNSGFTDIQVKIRYDIGFLQYITDDVPAYPLAYTKKSRWTNLKIEDGWLKIPALYGDVERPTALEILGYKSKEELFNWILEKDFKEIRTESLQEQTDYYTNLLKEETKYNKCCPGYILQAKNFLSRPTKEYNSIDKLGLEQYFKSMTIVVKGHLKNGEGFQKVIVGQ